MDFILFTLSWMGFNVILAVIPVIAIFILEKSKNIWIKFFWGIIWFVFLPNTVYLLTDPFHFVDYLKEIPIFMSIISIPFYLFLIIFGVITFIFSVYPLEKMLRKKSYKTSFIVLLNILVGIGIALGRVERINSWDAFTNVGRVVNALVALFTSGQLFFITLLFITLTNVLYFVTSKDKVISSCYQKLRKRI